MELAQMNAETGMEERHDTQRTAHLTISIDALTDCSNGVFETAEFLPEIRRTAKRLNTLADAIEKTAESTTKPLGTLGTGSP